MASASVSASDTDFRVEFVNPPEYYKPGHTVQGFVTRTLPVGTDGENVIELCLTCRGVARVGNRHRIIGEEEYFNECMKLLADPAVLTPGQEHRIPFSFDLPMNIPSSYNDVEHPFACGSCCEVPNVKIEFFATARLARAGKPELNSNKVNIHVMRPVDLNERPELMDPKILRKEVYIKGGCWRRGGLVGVEVFLKKRGFVPGESIPLEVKVHNKSRRKVEEVKLFLFQNFEERVQDNTWRTVHQVFLGGIHTPPVGSGRDSTTHHNLKVIPTATTANYSNCSCFKVTHVLELELHVKGILVEPERMEVALGMISFQNLSN